MVEQGAAAEAEASSKALEAENADLQRRVAV
jgi:hypothetical protein